MASTSAQQPAVLVPITVTLGGHKADMAVPSTVTLAELLPGLVSALGRLNSDTATQGFRVLTASGRELDQSQSLAEQKVRAGSVLGLQPAGSAGGDLRYDDLVEAIGAAVDSQRTPWQRGDSVALSSYAAAGLFVVAAALLALRGTDSILTAAIGVVGAGLLALAIVILVRLQALGGALALAMSVPVLLAASAYAVAGGPGLRMRIAAAGAAMLVGAAACLLLPSRQRATVVAPITAGLGLLMFGLLTAMAGIPEQRAATLVVAILTVLVLASPWVGMAQVPARIDALAMNPKAGIDPAAVTRQVGNADQTTLALRIAAGILTVALTPLVAVTPQGGLLMACVGLALMLGTRSLYGRGEVLASVVAGMLVVVVAGIVVTLVLPGLLPWIAGIAILVGAFVLAFNVVDVTLRPWLTRAADALHLIALIAVLPLAAMIWGIA